MNQDSLYPFQPGGPRKWAYTMILETTKSCEPVHEGERRAIPHDYVYGFL